jgi:hypothetical protein
MGDIALSLRVDPQIRNISGSRYGVEYSAYSDP